MKKLLMAAAVALMPLGALAQDFDKGVAAYDAGDYETALQELQPLAEQGNPIAQTNPGILSTNNGFSGFPKITGGKDSLRENK